MKIYQNEDIAAVDSKFEEVHGKNRRIVAHREDAHGWLQELDQQQSELNQALDGVEDLETYYDGMVKHFQQMRDEMADKKRKLTRDFDDCKRASIRISQSLRK